MRDFIRAQNLKKQICAMLALFVLLPCLFTLLMTLSYAIPNAAVEQSAARSIAMLEEEGIYASVNLGARVVRTDNWTDRLMLEKTQKAAGNSLLRAAMIPDYARYWHGYQVLLRPALAICNLTVSSIEKQISTDAAQPLPALAMLRRVNEIVLLALLAAVLILIVKQLNGWIALCFVIAVGFGDAIVVPMSLQYSVAAYVMLLACLALLLFCHNPRFCEHVCVGFFLIGATTSFFDLLTVPLITFGMPAALLVMIEMASAKCVRLDIARLALRGVCWAFGYGGIWACKWAIASIVLRRNVFAEALNQMRLRAFGDAPLPVNLPPTIYTLLNNLTHLIFPIALLIAAIAALAVIAVMLCRHRANTVRIVKTSIPLFLLCIAPYVWYLIFLNHSQEHGRFTYRAQIIAVFAILGFFVCLLKEKKERSHG
ncbi:MAG: hypothetical protein LBB67_01375 [Oscillospiraceae bacterium]|jgi:hypothetical protein|nr:hypothetical protein [Oscillospiraceae bacterium]